MGVLSRRKYLLLPESFTVNRLTMAAASSVPSKMGNYSEIQLEATLTCQEEIENHKRDLQPGSYSLHQFKSQHSRGNQSYKHQEKPLALEFVPSVKSVLERRIKTLESDMSRGSLEQNIALRISLIKTKPILK